MTLFNHFKTKWSASCLSRPSGPERTFEAFPENHGLFRCDSNNEIDVYETFQPYRSQSSLLTNDSKRLFKILTGSESVKVNCINVQLQDESECGAISLGLAVQLCFFPSDGFEIHYKLKNVRQDLFRCLKDNQMNYFSSTRKSIQQEEKILFTLNV